MGKLFHKLGGTKRKNQLERWTNGEESEWNFTVNSTEVTAQLLWKRRNAEADLTEESVKRQKQLETENKDLRKTVRKQAKTIVGLKSGTSTVYRRPSKGWSEYSRQQRYNIKKEVAGNVCSALSFCDEACLKPKKVEMENVSEGTIEILDVSTGEFEGKSVNDGKPLCSKKHTALYLKDKLAISNSGYHELSMISDLLPFSQLKNVLLH